MYASTGLPIAFQHWGSFGTSGQQPDNARGNENCVHFVLSMYSGTYSWNGPKNAWNDVSCSKDERYICQKKIDDTDAVLVQDSLIWFSNQAATFDDAQANCQSMGGQLFEPQTLLENNQVYELMEAKGRAQYPHWIGINDEAQEGT